MKKNARIVAERGDHRIEVNVAFTSKNGLSRDEVLEVARRVMLSSLRGMPSLPFVDFDEADCRIEF